MMGKQLLQELLILKHLNHPNVVKIKSIIMPKDLANFNELFIVMDYAQSNIEKLLKSPISLKKDHVQLIVYNLLCGLNYIQSANIVLRNIEPARILFYDNCEVKFCHFELATSITKTPRANNRIDDRVQISPKPKESNSPTKQKLSAYVETRCYLAPELLLYDEIHSRSIDTWSIGCIIAELSEMIKEPKTIEFDPYGLEEGSYCPLTCEASIITDKDSLDYLDTFTNRENIYYFEISNSVDPEMALFIERMLKFDPKKRIDIIEALNSPYFDSIRDPYKEIEAKIELNFEFEDMGFEKIRNCLINQIIKYN
jgi:mitogen-activated protein kinase 1/3